MNNHNLLLFFQPRSKCTTAGNVSANTSAYADIHSTCPLGVYLTSFQLIYSRKKQARNKYEYKYKQIQVEV